jgi:hypothetical protein
MKKIKLLLVFIACTDASVSSPHFFLLWMIHQKQNKPKHEASSAVSLLSRWYKVDEAVDTKDFRCEHTCV